MSSLYRAADFPIEFVRRLSQDMVAASSPEVTAASGRHSAASRTFARQVPLTPSTAGLPNVRAGWWAWSRI
jgi:hypothetical protein